MTDPMPIPCSSQNLLVAFSHRYTFSVFAIGVLGIFGVQTGAAQSPDTLKIQNASPDEVVSYGTRRAQAHTEAPYTLHIMDTATLDKTLPRTLPESLSALPGVMVQKTASGHGSPYIRGFTGNRTLAVIDGIRYNNATYRDGANEYFSHIDTFVLSQIEVVSGPASTLYGSEAVGGTLSLRTRDSGYQAETDQENFIHGEQIFRLSSGDQSKVSRTTINIGKGRSWGIRAGMSLKSFGNIRAADLGELEHTGYEEFAWDARLDFALNDIWTGSFAHQTLSQDDVWRTHSTIFSKSFAGTTLGTDLVRLKDQSRALSYLKLQGALSSFGISSADITFSHQPRTETEQRVRGNGLEIDQSFSSELLALNTVFESEFSRFHITYGLDYSHENIDSQRTDFDPLAQTRTHRIQGPVGDDANYQQVGIFLQNTIELTDQLGLEIGGRYSQIQANIGKFEDPFTHMPIDFENDWANFSSSARLNYKWGDQIRSNIWLAVSESFRAPNIADISRFGRSRTNEFEVASLNLEPEKFITGEIGYKFHTDAFRFSANYYYTDMRDYIDTVPTGRVVDGLIEVSKRNSATGYVHGVELTGQLALPAGFSLQGNATWLEGRLTQPTQGGNTTEPISRIMPLTGYVALNWENDRLWASTELQLVGEANALSAGDINDTQRIPLGGTPAYTLLNVKMGWHIHANMQLTLSANNLLNTAYRTHGSGSNEAGRHIMTGLSLSF